jgi:hypothetical protein
MWVASSIVLAFLALAIVVVIVAGVAKPATLRRWSGGLASHRLRRRVVLIGVPLVVVLVVGVMLIELRPQYQVELSATTEPVAGEAMPVTIIVSNRGSWAGTFEEHCYVDGSSWKPLRFRIAGHERLTVDVPLPTDLPAGDHVLQIGDSELTFHLLRPAEFEVSDLETGADLVKDGSSVTVTAQVRNTGEVGDTYEAVLHVDGRRAAAEEIFVGPEGSAEARFSVKLTGDRRHEIAMETGSVGVRSVKVVRPGTGHIMKWAVDRGQGSLVVKGGRRDAVVILTTADSAHRPRIAVYVRARSTATIASVPDGVYYCYFAIGRDWAPTLKRFLAVQKRGRFESKGRFKTVWSSGGYTYQIWTIWLGGAKSSDRGGRALPVDEDDFPDLLQADGQTT